MHKLSTFYLATLYIFFSGGSGMAPDGSRNHFYSSETVPMHMVQQPQKPGEAPMYKGQQQQMNRGQQQQRQPEEQAMFERRPAPDPGYQEPQSKSLYCFFRNGPK